MKAVITCGGTGTRLLPFTKELPKEMAPVFIKRDSCLQTIPLIQLIFENLYEEGIREFCFITGKTKSMPKFQELNKAFEIKLSVYPLEKYNKTIE